jgi:UDP-glucose 4-epimerase
LTRVLVIGGGFIGSHIVRGLLPRGWQARVLDDLSTGSPATLAGAEAQLEVQRGDMRSESYA